MNGVNGSDQPAVTCQPTLIECVTYSPVINDVTKLDGISPKSMINIEDTCLEISNGVENLNICDKNNLDQDRNTTIKSNGMKHECQTEATLCTETNVPLEIQSNNLQTNSINSSLDSVSNKDNTQGSYKPDLCSVNVNENTNIGLLEIEHITTSSFVNSDKSEENSEDPLKDNADDTLNINDNGDSDNLKRLIQERVIAEIKQQLCKSSESEEDSQDDDESEPDSQDDDESEQQDSQDDEKPERQNSHKTVSIDSESDMEQGDLSYGGTEMASNDVMDLDESGPMTDANDTSISSLSSDLQKIKDVPEKEAPVQESTLRRSSRTVKRTHYVLDSDNCDEYDSDEIKPKHMCKPIFIKDTRSLVEMSKQINPKKVNTFVTIDQPSRLQSKSSLIQNMAFCGTTITPVERSIPVQNAAPPMPILPSLTDDMFVVEAPSFIVPYVYEKPSIEPFREFVNKFGDTIREQEKKEQKEKLDKENAEKAEERRLRKENGEVSEPEGENVKAEEEKKRKKEEKKERRKRKTEDDDASWDGESNDSEDNSEDEDKSLELIAETPIAKPSTSTGDNYFELSLGKFFMDIGFHKVQEFVQSDLVKVEKRKLNREKRANRPTKDVEESIAQLEKNLELTQLKNAQFKSELKKCEQCNFKSDSALVIAHHLETPHMKNNMYKCSFCQYECKSPHDIFTHMEFVHGATARVERPLSNHQCPNCQYEDNSKGKLARHTIGCAKRFKPDFLLAPPTEWEPPAKIPKMNRPRNQMMGSFNNPYQRSQVGISINRPIGNSMVVGPMPYRPRARTPMGTPTRLGPLNNNNAKNAPVKHQPSLSIMPLPRQPQPVQSKKTQSVICEICDGYISDLEHLHSHMQWIHNVKIHPKMIYNRPPLNCQKCNFRSFTDYGLERHLLGSHGLVTRSMQESANNGKDSGRCPVCGKVYQMKLLAHVGKEHNQTLKPAHLSYKCTVCSATFGMYKQFEKHVYSEHSVVAKSVIDKKQTNSQIQPQPVKIRNETTVTPQSRKSSQEPK